MNDVKQKDQQLQVVYDGEALQAGVMDVRDLAPALLAFSELIDEANFVANEGNIQIRTMIRSEFRRGSFGLDIELVARSVFDRLVMYANGPNVSAAVATIALVETFFKTIKWLRNRKGVVVRENDQLRIVAEDGEAQVITSEVAQVFESRPFRRAADRALNPLRSPGVTSFRIDHDGAAVVEVSTEEVEYFALAAIGEDTEVDEYEGTYNLETVQLESGRKWRLGDGTSSFTADMVDEDFRRRIDRGEVRFSKFDTIRVRIRRTRWAAGGVFKTNHEILRVLDHKMRDQPTLPYGPEDP